MKTDLRTLPFSHRGSWLVISELGENWNGCGNEAGLYLRTVHSSAMTPLVARILPEGKDSGTAPIHGQPAHSWQ